MRSRRICARLLVAALLTVGAILPRAYADATVPLAGDGPGPDALAISPERLSHWSAMLRDDRPERRRAALDRLRSLGAEALPALAVHLRELSRAGTDERSLAPKLAQLRRLQRAGRAASASLAGALTSARSTAMLHAVELVAVHEALLAQRTPAAAEVMVGDLFRLAPSALRGEAVRARKRLGSLLGPAYLRHASAPDPAMRRLCRAALAALGMSTPRQAFQRADPAVLPQLLRVYGERRSAEALPYVVAYVGDARPSLHSAAREAVSHYGEGATPLLRELHLRREHEIAPAEWNASRLTRELERRASAKSEQTASASLAAAESALAAGKLTEAERALDHVLRARRGAKPDERLAAAYLALGGKHRMAAANSAALTAYRRALRSRPPPHMARVARARVLQLEAELRLRDGVADMHGLSTAAALDPTLTGASDLLYELSGTRAAKVLAQRRRAGIAAAILLALAGFLLLRDAKQRRAHSRIDRTRYA